MSDSEERVRQTEYLPDAADTDDEVSEPLLSSRSNPVDSKVSKGSVSGRSRYHKFYAYTLLGVFFISVINLIFLPRTSLSRDLRRLHGTKISKSELNRIYLESLARENNAREFLKEYSFKPHLAGQAYDLVEFTQQKFEEFGLKTYIETFDVWLNRPVDILLKMFDKSGEMVYDASFEEDKLPEDETTTYNNSVPLFHGYSANGNVTAKFTYANYGMKEDFELLKKLGVDVNGTICIMRYERIFRGLKVKHAEMNGCIGAVLYTDPYDDGEFTVKNGYELYPDGPARNPSAIQRGSVEYFTDYPGDPSTPGYGSVPGCERKPPTGRVPTIPSLPISSRSIEPILKQLNGKGPSLGWTGDIDFDYSVGPSTLDLNLFNLQNYSITPIWNVVGTIEGILKDEEIIIANHRDSWVLGGPGDPNAGSLALLEVIRGFSDLLKLGYKPLRTLKFISLDGEEYAMLGSTEFGETHSKELKKKTVAYLNLDTSVSGSHFKLISNPLLDRLIRKVTKQTPYIDGETTLYENWYKDSNATILFPGSGTDYAVFQNHLGIPIVDMAFTRGNDDPVYHYHSNYDSFHWMDTVADPEYKYNNCMSKFLGLLILGLSESELLPLETSNYASKIGEYFKSFLNDIPSHWYNVHIDESSFKYKSVVKPLLKLNDTPTFDTLVSLFENKVQQLVDVSTEYDAYVKGLQTEILKDYPWFKLFTKFRLAIKIKLANYKLAHLDRLYIDDESLVNREWMLHTIFAPHRDLGYTGDVLPGLHEAVMRKDFQDAVKWVGILILKFDGVIKKLD